MHGGCGGRCGRRLAHDGGVGDGLLHAALLAVDEHAGRAVRVVQVPPGHRQEQAPLRAAAVGRHALHLWQGR